MLVYRWSSPVVLELTCTSESHRGLIKTQIVGVHLLGSDLVGLWMGEEGREFAFLASSQRMLRVLVPQPNFEDHCCRRSSVHKVQQF